ncbi:hypothetical protein [Yoonia sp.]|uniref:hypothetical protein n=1 Tax=Yoonia sp. TaxID=2212373 RepID=UPI003918B4A3
MIRRAAVIAAGLVLAACATGGGPQRDLSDPAVRQLLQLPVPQYFATVAVATTLTRNCPRYRFDAELESMINQSRNAAGQGSLVAAAQRTGIELETDVMQRSFAAKHRVDLQTSDLCPAADAEALQNSALSALLVAV